MKAAVEGDNETTDDWATDSDGALTASAPLAISVSARLKAWGLKRIGIYDWRFTIYERGKGFERLAIRSEHKKRPGGGYVHPWLRLLDHPAGHHTAASRDWLKGLVASG